MDHNGGGGGGGYGMRCWPYYDHPLKGNLGLQLMSSVAERDTKPFLSNGGFFHRDCSYPEPDEWIGHRDNKILHMLPVNPNYSVLSDVSGAHTIQMLQPPKDEKALLIDEPQESRKDVPLKKRSQGPPPLKSPKPKKPKKVSAPKDETINRSVSRGRTGNKSTDLVINGIDLDISEIPTPICSCTGTPQHCYRWGLGGWQSACCTTKISTYPLPLNTKRRGARIAGRKMSQGAFKKVLEKLAGEGYNLSNPIDLRTYWAKHGTNKFTTIR